MRFLPLFFYSLKYVKEIEMGIETKEKQIGDSTYRINTYATGKNLAFMVRLTKVFGESVPAFFSGLQVEQEDENFADMTAEEFEAFEKKAEGRQGKAFFNAMQTAISLLVDNLDKDDVPKLIEEMVKAAQTQKDGQLVNYESDFAGGGVADLLQVMYFIIEENYDKVFLVGATKN